MSRNLCKTNCDWCGCDEVDLTGPEHPITPDEAGRYFSEFERMIVADAECMVCGAKYLAWVDERGREPWRHPLARLDPSGEPYIPDHVFDRHSTPGRLLRPELQEQLQRRARRGGHGVRVSEGDPGLHAATARAGRAGRVTL